jgi:hypothetical protein
MYPDDHDGRPLEGEPSNGTVTFADRIAERLANLSFRGGSSVVTPTEAAAPSDAAASEVVTLAAAAPEGAPTEASSRDPERTPSSSTESGAVPVVSPPEPVSPFLAELAEAMLAAADRERERIDAEVVAEAGEQVNKVQARAEAESAAIERQAQDDMDRAHHWADGEIERIHQEEARRLDERKAHLDDHLAQHAALIGAETARVELAVEEYRAQLAAFLVRLADEPSPVEIARLAADLPDTPDFNAIRAAARAEAVATLVSQGVDVHPAPATTPPASTTDPAPEREPVGVMAPGAAEASEPAPQGELV